uniref:triadin-like n=1 Tax=Myxine glutinosa TaxID=7769 RepID=UPI00358F02A4
MSGVLQVKGNSTVTTDEQIKATAGDKKVVKRVVRRVVGSGSLVCFPATWFLTLAIIATWSAVAVITFDLVDFHKYIEPICDGPCPLPGHANTRGSEVEEETKMKTRKETPNTDGKSEEEAGETGKPYIQSDGGKAEGKKAVVWLAEIEAWRTKPRVINRGKESKRRDNPGRKAKGN